MSDVVGNLVHVRHAIIWLQTSPPGGVTSLRILDCCQSTDSPRVDVGFFSLTQVGHIHCSQRLIFSKASATPNYSCVSVVTAPTHVIVKRFPPSQRKRQKIQNSKASLDFCIIYIMYIYV